MTISQLLSNAKIFARMKEFEKSIQELTKLEFYVAQNKVEKEFKADKLGEVYLDMAEVFDEVEDVDSAITYQKMAYDKISSIPEYKDSFK
jgi:hypothetical protein